MEVGEASLFTGRRYVVLMHFFPLFLGRFIVVRLSDIRKEVQCPICLGQFRISILWAINDIWKSKVLFLDRTGIRKCSVVY